MVTLRQIASITCACVMLAACAPPMDGKAEKARIEAECAARGFKTRYDQVKCENDGRLASRERNGLDVSADYRQYLLERLKVAADFDAKRITSREAELRDKQAWLDYQKTVDAYNESERKHRKEQADARQRELWKQLNPPEPESYRCHSYCPTGSDCYTDCSQR